MNSYIEHACDICGGTDVIEVPHIKEYTNNELVHICKECGFVYVKMRRSAKEIASAWSDEIYADEFSDDNQFYTARIPAVKARQTYVADFIDVNIGLNGKKLCDIGGGEGQFLQIARNDEYRANVFTIEPSIKNCKQLLNLGIDNYNGTLQDYIKEGKKERFDIVTMMWTLVNSNSCREMIDGAYKMLKDDGYLVIAEGSRILVPFKKPLNMYFSKNPQDTHSFHFSVNTLSRLLITSGFEISFINRYIDSDILCVIVKKNKASKKEGFPSDNYLDVYNFFERWHVETQMYYKKNNN